MRKSLIAQSVAAVISGLGLVAAANAAVVGPDPATAGNIGPADARAVAKATQLVVNTDNIGHINLVPYYSVQNGNNTLINIVNSDTLNGKAVKVRFRGASNSDDVFDFTVLMSPGDKFPFAIAKDDATGLPKVAHGDKSCVLGGTTGSGINVLSGEKFVTARLKPSLTADEKANETREGYVEILNMADIPPAGAGTLYDTIKHKDVSGTWKAVCDQTILSNNVGSTPTDYAQAVARGLQVPTSGLATNWTIINVANTLSFTGVGVAVEARTAGGLPGYGNIVLHAQNADIKDSAGVTLVNEILTSDPVLNVDGRVAYANYDFPDLSTPYLNSDLATATLPMLGGILTSATAAPAQAQRLTASMAKSSVANEFISVASLKAKTDWIFSMPTRRYNVAMWYKDVGTGNTTTDTIVYTNYGFTAAVPGPFVNLNFFDSTNTAKGAGVTGEPNWQICVTGLSFTAADDTALAAANRAGPATIDAEEKAANVAAALPPFVISPNTPSAPAVVKFCGEVSVFKFNADLSDVSAVGASVAARSIGTAASPLPFDAGWMRISTPGLTGTVFTAATGATTNGLPIIGSALTKLVNGAASAGISGNYGQSFEHKSTRPSNQP